MSDVLLDLPSHLRGRLVNALESGLLAPFPTLASLRSVLGNREATEDLAASLLELGRLGISGPAAAAWLRTVERAAARTRKPDLVWSGPEVPGLHARDTRRVYEELLGSAEHSIWASTYAFFDGPRAFEVLARRMEATPALRVTLLLNIQRKRGDTTASEHLVRRSQAISGRPTGLGLRVQTCFTTHEPLTLRDPVAFFMQRPLSPTRSKYSEGRLAHPADCGATRSR